MELIEKIDQYLKENLSEKRYIHSVGVMNRAKELAKIYGIEEKKAMACGLAHDIAKEMSKDETMEYIEKHNIFIDDIEKINIGLLHGKVGADMAKNQFDFSEEMQKSIEYHTTTNPEMDMLAKIIYVSDKTEIGRNSENYNVEFERELANKNINEAMIYIINENVKHMIEKGKLIHPKCIETRNRIIQELKVTK